VLLTGWSKRRRAIEARELLATAGGIFDRSLDPGQTMRAVADIAVPRLAEMCVIDLLCEDGTPGDTVVVAEHERQASQLLAIRTDRPLDLDGENPIARAVLSREPVVAPKSSDADGGNRLVPAQEVRLLSGSSSFRSMVAVPLIARGRLLGILSCFYSRAEPPHEPEHLALMRDIADRAAVALDNATMYVARTHLARTLQRSLLPDTLPLLEKLTLSSAYHPVGEGNEVGGDFYDVFTTPFGCWLVIGDVCGKGPEAAAVTALVRHSIRAFAFVRPSPAQVLGAVNEVMLGHALAHRFATVVLARLELTGDPVTAVVAGAGHPPPLLLAASGAAHCLPLEGTMLGVRPGCDVLDLDVELEPGTTLVLYTDGLLDAGAPLRGLTTQKLCEVLAEHGSAAPPAIIERLERLAFSSGAGRLRDDVAVVAARVDD
jgi:serine phosphatase RsbU (regulator of sigma subunit)